jgi:hypothetical protein
MAINSNARGSGAPLLSEKETEAVTLPGFVPGDTPLSNSKKSYFETVERNSKREGAVKQVQSNIANEESFLNNLPWDLKMVFQNRISELLESQRKISSERLQDEYALFLEVDQMRKNQEQIALMNQQQKAILDELDERHHQKLLEDWFTLRDHHMQMYLRLLEDKVDLIEERINYLNEIEDEIIILLQDSTLDPALRTELKSCLAEIREVKELHRTLDVSGLKQSCVNDDGSINIEKTKASMKQLNELDSKLERVEKKVDKLMASLKNSHHESYTRFRELQEAHNARIETANTNLQEILEQTEQQLRQINTGAKTVVKNTLKGIHALQAVATISPPVQQLKNDLILEVQGLVRQEQTPETYQEGLSNIISKAERFITSNEHLVTNNKEIDIAISVVEQLSSDLKSMVVSDNPSLQKLSPTEEERLAVSETINEPLEAPTFEGHCQERTLEEQPPQEEVIDDNSSVKKEESKASEVDSPEETTVTNELKDFIEDLKKGVDEVLEEEEYADVDKEELTSYLDELAQQENLPHEMLEEVSSKLKTLIEQLPNDDLQDELDQVLICTTKDTFGSSNGCRL